MVGWIELSAVIGNQYRRRTLNSKLHTYIHIYILCSHQKNHEFHNGVEISTAVDMLNICLYINKKKVIINSMITGIGKLLITNNTCNINKNKNNYH